MDIPSVRILVVGDSGVGKTSLLQAICNSTSANGKLNGSFNSAPSGRLGKTSSRHHVQWTTGCELHLLLHRYMASNGTEQQVYVEFVDVGGNPRYDISRSVFFQRFQGVVFVHDLSNTRSYNNMRRWISEIDQAQQSRVALASSRRDSMSEFGDDDFIAFNEIPKMVISNKRDLLSFSDKRPNAVDDLNMPSVELSALTFLENEAGVFYDFLDRVIARQLASSASQSTLAFGSSTSSSHLSSLSGSQPNRLQNRQVVHRNGSSSNIAGHMQANAYETTWW